MGSTISLNIRGYIGIHNAKIIMRLYHNMLGLDYDGTDELLENAADNSKFQGRELQILLNYLGMRDWEPKFAKFDADLKCAGQNEIKIVICHDEWVTAAAIKEYQTKHLIIQAGCGMRKTDAVFDLLKENQVCSVDQSTEQRNCLFLVYRILMMQNFETKAKEMGYNVL